MPDREKVLNSIKACAHHPDHDCQSCDYCGDNFLCFNDQLIEDFETLMKEQEERIKQLEATSVIHNVSFTQIGENNKQIVNNGTMTMTFGK